MLFSIDVFPNMDSKLSSLELSGKINQFEVFFSNALTNCAKKVRTSNPSLQDSQHNSNKFGPVNLMVKAKI